jgi:uncharacterized membrane protein YccC
MATLKTFPLATLYLFVILPRVDGYEMLVLTLAPALLWMGYIQADPKRSPQALPMFSCFIVAMGFQARFQADFANFINTGLAQVGGIVATLAVTRLFRSASVVRTGAAHRARELGRRGRACRYSPALPPGAVDGCGRGPPRASRRAHGLGEGVTATSTPPMGLPTCAWGATSFLRRALSHVPHDIRHHLGTVLADLAALYAQRWRKGDGACARCPARAYRQRLRPISLSLPAEDTRQAALRALVGLRCNLFPDAPPPQRVAAA